MKRLVKFFGGLPLAPFGLPVLVSGPIWANNIMRLAFEDLLPIMLTMLGITALLLIAIRLFAKGWARASLITMIWVGYSLYLPALVRFFTTSDIVLIIALILGALFAFDISRRVPKEAEAAAKANSFANLALVIPALVTLVSLGSQQADLERGRPDPQQTFKPFPAQADKDSPDVWHIVMDRYAGSRILNSAYDHDNRKFLGELRKRGFNVADDAYSNYQITPLSLASTLNASYLDDYAKAAGRQDDLVTMFYAIDRNRAFDFFKSNGYEIIFSGSWADVTVNNSQADRDINYRGASEVPRIALLHSVPGSVGQMLGLPYTNGRMDQCQRVKHKFAKLTGVANEPQQKFVFAHFLVPHPPYVLAADGTCQTEQDMSDLTRKAAYSGMVQYANRELLKLIDAIQAGPRAATIILHADEGPYPARYAFDEPAFPADPEDGKHFFNLGPEIRREKTSIIMAVHHADAAQIEAPRTSVNLYPQILNHSFGADMPIRKDRVMMFPATIDMSKLKDFAGELLDKPADQSAD